MSGRFDPWTSSCDEALAADEAGGDPVRGHSPFAQWVEVQQINSMLKDKVLGGDGFAVLDAVSRCARSNLLMPDWLAVAFIQRYDQVLNLRVGSWDEAFGAPIPKSKQLRRLRARRELRVEIWNFVIEQTKADPTQPIDKLIEEAGERTHAGKTLAGELYYEAVKFNGFGAAEVKARLRNS